MFSYGAIELEVDKDSRFKVNCQRVKQYLGTLEETELIESILLDEI